MWTSKALGYIYGQLRLHQRAHLSCTLTYWNLWRSLRRNFDVCSYLYHLIANTKVSALLSTYRQSGKFTLGVLILSSIVLKMLLSDFYFSRSSCVTWLCPNSLWLLFPKGKVSSVRRRSLLTSIFCFSWRCRTNGYTRYCRNTNIQ